MPTESAAPVVTPSSLNPPKNGAASQTQQSTEPKPATAAPVDREAQLKAREEAIAAREAKFQNELKANADSKKGLGAKLSRLNELEKKLPELEKFKSEREQRDELRRLNPVAALEEDFGKDWREKLTALSVNGVPPTDLIAAEFKKMRADFKAELEAERQRTAQQTTQAEEAEVEQTRAMVASDSAAWYEANAKDFPVFERLGDAKRIGQILGQRIEQEHARTGKLITAADAANALEGEMFGIVETAIKHDKYKSKLQSQTQSGNVAPSSGVPSSGAPAATGAPRRTLDNSMTASTSGRAPPSSDAERFERASKVFNDIRAKGKA